MTNRPPRFLISLFGKGHQYTTIAFGLAGRINGNPVEIERADRAGRRAKTDPADGLFIFIYHIGLIMAVRAFGNGIIKYFHCHIDLVGTEEVGGIYKFKNSLAVGGGGIADIWSKFSKFFLGWSKQRDAFCPIRLAALATIASTNFS